MASDAKRGRCPQCGSPTRLEPITRGGRPQVALCTSAACGWDGWIREVPQPDPEPVEGEAEPRWRLSTSFLLDAEDGQELNPTDVRYLHAIGKELNRLRARVQPDASVDYTEGYWYKMGHGRKFAMPFSAIAEILQKHDPEIMYQPGFRRVQPRRVSRAEFRALTREIAEGYRTHAGADEIAVDVLDILGIEITPPEGGEDDDR